MTEESVKNFIRATEDCVTLVFDATHMTRVNVLDTCMKIKKNSNSLLRFHKKATIVKDNWNLKSPEDDLSKKIIEVYHIPLSIIYMKAFDGQVAYKNSARKMIISFFMMFPIPLENRTRIKEVFAFEKVITTSESSDSSLGSTSDDENSGSIGSTSESESDNEKDVSPFLKIVLEKMCYGLNETITDLTAPPKILPEGITLTKVYYQKQEEKAEGLKKTMEAVQNYKVKYYSSE